MITIKVNGNEHEVEEGVRLVNAIEDLGYDISHRCGGKAMCTTCRVNVNFDTFARSYLPSLPSSLTNAERKIFKENDLLFTSLRLSCQILTIDGLDVKIGMPVSENEWDEAGPRPADTIEP